MFSTARKHIRGSILVLAAMLVLALVSGSSLSNVAYAQEPGDNEGRGAGENKRPESCNGFTPADRNTPEFAESGCPGRFASYDEADIDRTEADGGDVVMEQFISSQAPADFLIPSVLIQTAGDCEFGSWGDNIHLSGGDVSVHGWWTDRSPPNCPSQADVEVWLQGLWCWNPPYNCSFSTLPSGTAHNEERVYAGGGSANRTNARHPCEHNLSYVDFRALIDVDLVGVSDPSGYEIKENTLLCYPE